MESVIDTTIKLLEKYPLCNRCLGRLFARLGRGLGNDERGKALKIASLLELHKKILNGNKELIDTAKRVALNSKLESKELLKLFGVEPPTNPLKCYICEDRLDNIINSFAEIVTKIVNEKNIESFIIGVKAPEDLIKRENILVREYRLAYWESIKREIKREVGKRVQTITKARVDFDDPQTIFIIDLNDNTVKEEVRSLLVYGKYRKLGRLISQNIWIGKDGKRKYSLSIEDVAKHSLEYVKASSVVLHIGGREDTDVRVIGDGRPIVLEYKSPNRKDIDLAYLNKVLNSYTPWIQFNINMRVKKAFVSRLKSFAGQAYKIYRALIFSEQEITVEKLQSLEKFFENKLILQRTPTRVLRRKSDRLRKKMVHQVKTILISPHIFLALIKCDGGLYVKELITGDNGRTSPSFSEFLGSPLQCLMLDVMHVHEYI
ncbi:MAG: tRNA pseudouridine(54/55) synthase Pus10 [Ignisphaera sp.]